MRKQIARIGSFSKLIEDKRLYCYGAGLMFRDFLIACPEVNIHAVIDKNIVDRQVNINGRDINVINIDGFCDNCDEAVLLITCLDYQEVEHELGMYQEFKDIDYYVYCEMNTVFDDNAASGKYQITEFRMQDFNAGQKAPSDIARIAAFNGYKAMQVVRGTVRNGKEQTAREWNKVCDEVKDYSTVIIQYPIVDASGRISRFLDLRNKKHIKIICVVHDIEIFRRKHTNENISQYNMLKNCADIWIVHNAQMKKLLVREGFIEERIICLNIFDYLIESSSEIRRDEGIIIAGNMDINKSPYIYKLNEIENVTFNLFGANYSATNKYDNICYFGAYLPEQLIANLQGKYGLVWDGDSLDTCSGLTGEYLKINNPHKLSLYLAVGLPVIIWEEAAEAEFVLKENVGFTVKSLYELPDKLASVSDADYEIMKRNAEIVGMRLRKGEYLTNAIRKAEMKIQEIRENEGV